MYKKNFVLVSFITFFSVITSCDFKASEDFSGINAFINNSITVEYKNTLETISILQNLWVGDGWPYGNLNNPVQEDINDFFKSYKDHSAVKMTEEIANGEASFSGPISIALHISELPNSKIIHDDEALYKSVGGNKEKGKEYISRYIKEVNEFYRIANVESFLDKHKKYYKGALEEIKTQLKGAKGIVGAMEKYYGKTYSKYGYVFSLTNFSMALGISLNNDTGSSIYQLTGVLSNMNDSLNTFGFEDKKQVYEITVHEYGHSFVSIMDNKKYEGMVNELEYLYNPIKLDMTNIAYDTWDNALEEHIVRAVEIRVWESIMNDKDQAKKLRDQYIKELKFRYIPFIEEKLKYYEMNRVKFKSFDDYLPLLIKSLKEIKS